MKICWDKIKIFLRPGVTDMRNQINGLSIIVEKELKMNPLSGNLFFFCNRRRQIIKSLYWDKTGFCLWQKRLERERFPWPADPGEFYELSEARLSMLLSGIDFFHMHRELKYRSVS